MGNFILVGEAGSGKDTFFEILKETHHRLAFGDELSLVCKNLRINGVQSAYNQLYHLFEMNPPRTLMKKLALFRSIPQGGLKDRLLKQELGTYCREYDDLIWIRPVLRQAKKLQNVIITDCRRIVEFNNFFPEFTSVYIDATEAVRLERLKSRDGYTGSLHHAAEGEIKGLKELCDYCIMNNGGLEDFKKEVLQYDEVY